MFKSKNNNKYIEYIDSLIEQLRNTLHNSEQLDCIIGKLRYAKQNITQFNITINGNSFYAYNKDNQDSFSLEITDTDIIISLTYWNNHHHETRAIKYDGPITVVRKDETTHYIMSGTEEPSSTLRKQKVEVYKDNEILYIREYSSETSAKLDSLTSLSTISETYINDQREAIKKTINIGDENAFSKTGVEYFFTPNFEAPPFNDTSCKQKVFMYGMSTTSEEFYNSFLSQFKFNSKALKYLPPKQN